MENPEDIKIIVLMTIVFLLTIGAWFYIRYKFITEPNKKKEEELKKLKEHRA